MKTLTEQLLSYLQRAKMARLDQLAEEWGIDLEILTQIIAENYQDFRDAKIVNNLFILHHEDTEPWFYEIAQGYITSDDKYKMNRKNKLEVFKIDQFIEKHEWDEDYHMSVFMHDLKWFKNDQDHNSLVRADYVYVELDRDGDLDKAIEDANKIVAQFPYHTGIKTWYSGNSSIHIGIPALYFGDPIVQQRKSCGRGKLFYNLAHMIGGNCRFDNDGFDPWLATKEQCEEEYKRLFDEEPPEDPQRLRQQLEHFDPNLYNFNSLIRLPLSVHPKAGLRKQEVLMPSLREDDPPIGPYLLHWTYKAMTPVKVPRKHKASANVTKHANFVEKFYLEHVEGFDPDDINGSGWVPTLYSPFYDDENPSVSICIDEGNEQFGWYRDFGNPDDSMDFYDFVAKIKNISRRKAKRYVKQYAQK